MPVGFRNQMNRKLIHQALHGAPARVLVDRPEKAAGVSRPEGPNWILAQVLHVVPVDLRARVPVVNIPRSLE